MAYKTLLHFMTQLSRRRLSSLGGAPFAWFGYMNILGSVLKFKKMLLAYIRDSSVGCLNIVCQCLPSVLWKFGVW
ncbi:hypothetical protein RGQ29_027609 [Quercus rubra]|uniref:Uncharacterized protein n=1 Tax=Quercus rubra TaxID=3512 RepID=A0AAN7ILJ6_QUERU|nr:hypothetical protein RGQ29_027609 [Quercus rubra]